MKEKEWKWMNEQRERKKEIGEYREIKPKGSTIEQRKNEHYNIMLYNNMMATNSNFLVGWIDKEIITRVYYYYY